MSSKEKYVGVFWGIVLILLGVVFLVTQTTSFQINDPWLAMALAAGLSLAFFVSYFLSGTERWGWLFPACILAGLTLTIGFSQLVPQPQGGWMAAPILLGVAAPFLVIYFRDREKNSWALIPAYIMIVITLIAALSDVLPGELEGTLVLLLISLAFLGVFLLKHARWALIVFIVLVLASIIPAVQSDWSYVIGPAILIALGGLLVYRATRKQPEQLKPPEPQEAEK
jgi:hypothetical protein